MTVISFPQDAQRALLLDAASRDKPTARRVALLDILWHERYLTRDQLIVRVEWLLGRDAFGIAAREDTFYRDMRAVKQALHAAGYELAYRRNKPRPGYYLAGEPPVSAQISAELAGAAAELNREQIAIFSRLLPAERAAIGTSISDSAREVVAYRIAQENPGMPPEEANRCALQLAYMEKDVHSAEDLILYKLKYYRMSRWTKHPRDIYGILTAQEEKIDYGYIREWAGRLGLISVWEELLRKRPDR